MRLTLLGTGGPTPNPDRFSQSSLLEADGERILVDAGRGVVIALTRLGIPVGSVDTVLVTHHHYDHIGALSDVLLTSWMKARGTPLRIVGPPGTQRIVRALWEDAFAPDIAWRVAEHAAALAAVPDEAATWPRLHDPATFLEVTEVLEGSVVGEDRPGGWHVRVTETEHGRTYLRQDDWHSIAYRVERDGRSVVFSGDTARTPELVELARGADCLVMNAMIAESQFVSAWDGIFARTMIASAAEAGRTAAEAGVSRLVMTHLARMATVDGMTEDAARNFAGDIVVAHDGLTIEV